MKDILKRAVAYMPPTQWRQLMSVLVLRGESFSEWVRKKADEEIANK